MIVAILLVLFKRRDYREPYGYQLPFYRQKSPHAVASPRRSLHNNHRERKFKRYDLFLSIVDNNAREQTYS